MNARWPRASMDPVGGDWLIGDEGGVDNGDDNNVSVIINSVVNSTSAVAALVIPAYIRTTTTAVMSVILVIGVTGNVLVPIVIVNSKDLRNSTNVFLANLALADLLVILICLPTGYVELHSTPGVWYLGETMCELLAA